MIDPLSLAEHGPVIPVIVLQRVDDAVPLAEALVAGGVKVLEVTLRTDAALACIEAIARAVPEAIVGAGTVRSAVDARAALAVGSRFAVSPGYTDEIGRACRDIGLPLLTILDPAEPAPAALHDRQGLAARRCDARAGTCYLIRPDQHVAARWRRFDAAAVRAALGRATGQATA